MSKKLILAALMISASAEHCFGDILFDQSFSSGQTLTTYFNATPTRDQFNSIATSGTGTVASIVNDDLRFDRTLGANAGGFTRLALNNSGNFDAVKGTFTFNATGTAAATTAAVLWLGSGLSTANSGPLNANVHSRIGFNFTVGGFQVRDIGTGTNSTIFTSAQTFSWFVNNSGASLLYDAPDSTIASLANDQWDIWSGGVRLLNGSATTASQSITDVKFLVSSGTGTIDFDSFQLESITAVPEPTSQTLLGIAGCMGLAARYRCHKSKKFATA